MQTLLERLYRDHRQGLFTLALSIVREPSAAEDAVHEAFVRLCRRPVPPTGDAAAYVFAAVRNAAIDLGRRRQAQPAIDASIFDNHPSKTVPPDAPLLGEERDRLLRNSVDELPDEQRQAVVLRLYGGLTFEQMAQVLGEPLSTVSTRYRRALEQLRKALELKV